ncbi:hypothetical protein [Streptomyces sp. SID13031]|uniref:hypothetical protein n=1 Tax=Streptomyces sp. SID13031 TaxID=2706046 RepID=UPI0013C78FC5|nr:hypothetical protein [Streptomyces sp. SID13031]NEA34960.1 hypothetical protein [Streptomyces sp. SID13031]
MRFLPDKPSLGFLRKEAKDLLAALRESGPPASLADAQRALAAEYGMRDWAELKSEVERRAAAVPVAPAGLTEALASAFGLGVVVGAASPVSFTPMGRCWSIITDRGRWLAVTVYDWITDEQAELGARLRNAAVAKGIVAPTPVRSLRGRLIEAVQGQNWRVHEWIEVGPVPVLPTPLGVARQVGTTYGTLHSLAIPSESPMSWYLTTRKSSADWSALLDRARAAQKPWAGQLAQSLPALADLSRIELDADPADFILCNSNLIPEHVRIGHHDELLITEWDFAGSMTPALEIGAALGQWTLRPTLNPKAVAAFRQGYLEAAGHWPKLTLSSFAVAAGGWLNWTYNMICEAINPSDEDQADVTERGTLDLLTHPMTRASLEELLAATDG